MQEFVQWYKTAIVQSQPAVSMLSVQVSTNGVSAGYIQSSPESKFNKLALVEDNVKSVTLTTSGLDADVWIHILEVSEVHMVAQPTKAKF